MGVASRVSGPLVIPSIRLLEQGVGCLMRCLLKRFAATNKRVSRISGLPRSKAFALWHTMMYCKLALTPKLASSFSSDVYPPVWLSTVITSFRRPGISVGTQSKDRSMKPPCELHSVSHASECPGRRKNHSFNVLPEHRYPASTPSLFDVPSSYRVGHDLQ